MAIYHLSVKIGGRAKGQSAIAASAYRSGEKLKDYETGLTSDYSRKQRIVCCGIALCENAPEEYADRETLWNAVHKIEKSKDARLWREIEVALPKELNQDEQIATVREFVSYLTQKGMCADWAIHDSGDGNPHAHIMLTTRSILPNGKWAGKSRKVYDLDENGQRIFQKIDKTGRKQYKCHKEDYNDWNDKERVEEWRAVWAECCNARLSEQDRIDHRSYARQGIDQIPTIHEGYAARQRVADGLPSDRVQLNDKIRQQNSLLEDIENQVNSIESEIQQLTAEFKSAQRVYINKHLLEFQKIGFEFPNPNSDEYAKMYEKLVQSLQKVHAFTLRLAKECAINCPELYYQRAIGEEPAKRLEQRLKEENITFIRSHNQTKYKGDYWYTTKFEDRERVRQIVQDLCHSKSKPEHSTPDKPQFQPISQETIDNIISLKKDYVSKYLICCYLQTTHKSTERQSEYQIAQGRVNTFKEYSVKLRELDEQIKKTINPIKKKKLRNEHKDTYDFLEVIADKVKSALKIPLAYEGQELSYQTATPEHLNAILERTYVPLHRLEQASDIEIKQNELIDDLTSIGIDAEMIKSAVNKFRDACAELSYCSDEDRQRAFSAIINYKVPLMKFENYPSEERQIAYDNIKDIISSLKFDIPSSSGSPVENSRKQAISDLESTVAIKTQSDDKVTHITNQATHELEQESENPTPPRRFRR